MLGLLQISQDGPLCILRGHRLYNYFRAKFLHILNGLIVLMHLLMKKDI